jgi:RNA polymerase sigma factor (sigma-70 family)
MARHSAVPPESFNEILAWLNPDRDVAGSIYVQLRDDLTRFFRWAGCNDPDGLTDETFDRVAKKVREVAPGYNGDPKHYFHGVARNLIKEDAKNVKKQVPLDNVEPEAPTATEEEETGGMREECLESCLQELSAEKRDLIMNYYAKEKQAKIDHRAVLARQLGTSVETLRVKVHRLRAALEKCIGRCLDQRVEKE